MQRQKYIVKVFDNGDKHYYKNGLPHRNNGPAIDNSTGYKAWYKNGERHRIDGPAIEYVSGYKEWYYNGKHIKVYSQEEFSRIVKTLIFA